MARLIRIYGLASFVIVDDHDEVDDLLAHQALERRFRAAGPFFNRMIARALLRQFRIDGQLIRSMRERDDPARNQGQGELLAKLDSLAVTRPWAMPAIEALARYVRHGKERDVAMAALAYVLAVPFLLGPDKPRIPFDEGRFMALYDRYRWLRRARSPFSPIGFLIRATYSDSRTRRKLLNELSGDDYGLHAIAVTLDNAIEILETMRQQFMRDDDAPEWHPRQLAWLSVRTAPRTVLRQVHEDFTLPHVPDRVPAFSLILLRMRDSLNHDVPAGYEFATGHWSACPARRYLQSLFALVAEGADPASELEAAA